MIEFDMRDTWIGVFDILGFKNLICKAEVDLSRKLLLSKLNDLIRFIDTQCTEQSKLDYSIFSDTVVVFTPNSEPVSYSWFISACKRIIEKSIYIELPLKGAISVGPAFISSSPPIFLGTSFVEAYEHCEDQDWLGLLLTPTAINILRCHEINPLHHDFVEDSQIPL